MCFEYIFYFKRYEIQLNFLLKYPGSIPKTPLLPMFKASSVSIVLLEANCCTISCVYGNIPSNSCTKWYRSLPIHVTDEKNVIGKDYYCYCYYYYYYYYSPSRNFGMVSTWKTKKEKTRNSWMQEVTTRMREKEWIDRKRWRRKIK